MSHPGPHRRPSVAGPLLAVAAAVLPSLVIAAGSSAEPEMPVRFRESLATYLDTFQLGADARQVLEPPGAWSASRQNTCLKLLTRLASAPASRSADWTAHAGDASAAAADPAAFHDRLVRVRGRAVFVVPVPLSPEDAELQGRKTFDLVRIITDEGLATDVMTGSAPRQWLRSAPIDMRAEAVGLAVGREAAGGVGPSSPASAIPADMAWPRDPASLLIVATRVAWFPETPLGDLRMDYGLFDTVADGHKLLPADGDAFYAMLTAVGRATQEGIEAAAPKTQEIIPLINPGEKWIENHRGDAVRISGIARRATRIEADDPLRRKQIGGDHYWELVVFVDTPMIQIGDKIQDDFPIVCCVRRLPKEMPAGDTMAERVEVAGFVLKRYAYPLPAGEGQKASRRETPLVIARQAIWHPDPSTKRTVAALGWIFTALSAVVLSILAAAGLAMMRRSRPHGREPLPDRIDVE